MNSGTLRSFSRFTLIGLSAASILAFASGCATEPNGDEDPGVAAMAIVGESTDNADEPDLGRMRGGALGLVDGLPGIALKCDEAPSVTHATVCGSELAASESYAWTDCRMGMGGQGKGKGSGGPVSSGSIEVRHDVAGAAEGCDASSALEFTDVTDLDIERVTPSGRHMTLTGKVTATSVHSAEGTTFTKQVQISVRRTVADSDGATLREVQLSGTASVAFSVDDEGTKRVVDGELSADLGDGAAQGITLKGVTRLDSNLCRWPVAGTLTRVDADGTPHELVFSDNCGTATLDGESIDLNAQRGKGMHGKRGKGSCMR
jgi:uncharacterized protein YndB with AHSA1/START domain